MKKVCIVTNYHNTGNYGALLQAYALNKEINTLGFECKTLDFSANNQNGGKLKRYSERIRKSELKELIGDFIRDFGKAIVRKKIAIRRNSLNRFRETIPHTHFYTEGDLENISDDYDYFICGSDQIWRPTFEGHLVKTYWLGNIKNNAIKASYAVSIGINILPENIEPQVIEYLSTFDFISVREKSAKNYLKSLLKRDISLVVDPVFLLTKEDWENIVVKPRISDSYIFVYMIHGSRELFDSITRFSHEKKLKIITFPYMSYYFKSIDFGFGDQKIYDADPGEFLGLIQNAKYLFTDSFHATAFSIIFHKSFWVSAANEKAISRIDNLMGICGLDDHIIPGKGLKAIEYAKFPSVNWDTVDSNLYEEIRRSKAFLKGILKDNNQ